MTPKPITKNTLFYGDNPPILRENEIVWQRTNVHSDSKTWSNVSDTIFFYTKSNQLGVFQMS